MRFYLQGIHCRYIDFEHWQELNVEADLAEIRWRFHGFVCFTGVLVLQPHRDVLPSCPKALLRAPYDTTTEAGPGYLQRPSWKWQPENGFQITTGWHPAVEQPDDAASAVLLCGQSLPVDNIPTKHQQLLLDLLGLKSSCLRNSCSSGKQATLMLAGLVSDHHSSMVELDNWAIWSTLIGSQ